MDRVTSPRSYLFEPKEKPVTPDPYVTDHKAALEDIFDVSVEVAQP